MLAFHQPAHWDVRPAGDDRGDLLLGHLLAQQARTPLPLVETLLLGREAPLSSAAARVAALLRD